MMNPPLTWVRIHDIGPGSENLIVRGIIVRKQDPRVIQTKRSDNSERGVWSFTLRDSPTDLINVSAWGSPDYVKNLSSPFQIGDVVSLFDVKVTFRKFKDNNEFQPIATSAFSLLFNENQSKISRDPKYTKEFEALRFTPTKPEGNFLTINDVVENGKNLRSHYVNLLVAVHDVQSKKQFTSKAGRPFECRDVVLIDNSPHQTLLLTVWGTDLLSMSENWISRKTVLFLTDVRVDWSDFRQKVVVSTTSRTIITENPRTSKAQLLMNFLTSEPFQAPGKLEQTISKYAANPSMINKVMSCQSVLATAQDKKQSGEFSALVYALLEGFDIDSSEDRIMISKCMRCQFKVDPDMAVCLNANCSLTSGLDPPLVERVYDLRVNLLDHTGYLTNCKLLDTMATKLIGYKAPMFSELSTNERTSIKWQHLLKYFAARIVVVPFRENPPMICVISLEPISMNQLSSLMPMM